MQKQRSALTKQSCLTIPSLDSHVNINCFFPRECEPVNSPLLSSISTETPDSSELRYCNTESVNSLQEPEPSILNQCLIQSNDTVTFLFPQFYSFVRVISNLINMTSSLAGKQFHACVQVLLYPVQHLFLLPHLPIQGKFEIIGMLLNGNHAQPLRCSFRNHYLHSIQVILWEMHLGQSLHNNGHVNRRISIKTPHYRTLHIPMCSRVNTFILLSLLSCLMKESTPYSHVPLSISQFPVKQLMEWYNQQSYQMMLLLLLNITIHTLL